MSIILGIEIKSKPLQLQVPLKSMFYDKGLDFKKVWITENTEGGDSANNGG